MSDTSGTDRGGGQSADRIRQGSAPSAQAKAAESLMPQRDRTGDATKSDEDVAATPLEGMAVISTPGAQTWIGALTGGEPGGMSGHARSLIELVALRFPKQ